MSLWRAALNPTKIKPLQSRGTWSSINQSQQTTNYFWCKKSLLIIVPGCWSNVTGFNILAQVSCKDLQLWDILSNSIGSNHRSWSRNISGRIYCFRHVCFEEHLYISGNIHCCKRAHYWLTWTLLMIHSHIGLWNVKALIVGLLISYTSSVGSLSSLYRLIFMLQVNNRMITR